MYDEAGLSIYSVEQETLLTPPCWLEDNCQGILYLGSVDHTWGPLHGLVGSEQLDTALATLNF